MELFLFSAGLSSSFFAGGREGGESTVDESQFDNAVASAVVLGDRGVQEHYVLTFISITFLTKALF